MKRILLLLSIVLFTVYSYSQTSNKLWGGLEIGYGLGLSDRGDNYKQNYGGYHKMSTSTIRGVLGYYIIPDLSVGVGIGLNSYTKPSLNTLPFWLDFRYHPLVNKSLVLNGALGYSMITSENDLKGKFMSDITVGYKICNLNKISIIPAIGYNFVNYSIEDSGKQKQSRHSLFARISFIY